MQLLQYALSFSLLTLAHGEALPVLVVSWTVHINEE